MRNGHLILGESASFVRANARCATESLNRLEILNEDLLRGHSLGGEGHAYSHCDLKAFWNIGY